MKAVYSSKVVQLCFQARSVDHPDIPPQPSSTHASRPVHLWIGSLRIGVSEESRFT